MNVKVIGAVMIITAGGIIGFCMGRMYTLQLEQLEQLIFAFDYIKCELLYRMSPLTDQFQQCAQLTRGSVCTFFSEMTRELESQIKPSAAYCMQAVISRTSELSPAAIDVLTRMGKTLGNFDLQGQLACIEDTIAYAKNLLADLKSKSTTRIRNYQTFGFCAGAALVIFFI